MTNLSPAAQAVMDACTDAPIQINWATKLAAAAALRAVADQLSYEEFATLPRVIDESELLAIAAKLEGQ